MENRAFFQKIISMKGCRIEIGGSVTNTVRVLQTILNRKNATTYLGAIGNDSNGKVIQERLEQEGVRCIFKKVNNFCTGICAVLIYAENRSLCTDLGASKLYSIEDLNKHYTTNTIKNAKCIYFSVSPKISYLKCLLLQIKAFFLGVCFDCVEHLLKSEGKIIAFNIGAVFLCKKYPKQILEILKYVDIVFGNNHVRSILINDGKKYGMYILQEVEALAKLINIASKDIRKNCSSIVKYNNKEKIVIATQGAKPIIIATKENVTEYEVKKEDINGEIVDTNGAGDAFAGGFLAKFLQGTCVKEAVKCGITAAHEVIKNVGCCFNRERLYSLCK